MYIYIHWIIVTTINRIAIVTTIAIIATITTINRSTIITTTNMIAIITGWSRHGSNATIYMYYMHICCHMKDKSRACKILRIVMLRGGGNGDDCDFFPDPPFGYAQVCVYMCVYTYIYIYVLYILMYIHT